MQVNYNRKKERRIQLLVSVLVFTVLLLGLIKIVEMGVGLFQSRISTRQMSIAESIAVVNAIDNKYKVSMSYEADYMKDFKALDIPLSKEEQEFLFVLSKDYEVSYPLLLGMIELESNFKKDEISDTNDYGLMQINEVNHEWLRDNLGLSDFLDPYENIRSGTYILSNLFDKYHDENEVLMAYNMGEGGAKKLWDKGVFETKYSKKIMANKRKYEALLK